MNHKLTPILIVNGGKDPHGFRWIELCIDKIIHMSTLSNYKIFVWNNNYNDKRAIKYLTKLEKKGIVEFYNSNNLEFKHFHAEPLQILFEKSLKYSPDIVIVMDSDCHPISKGWDNTLITKLENGNVICGIYRDELKDGITPYIHPSCAAIDVNFIKEYNLRFDDVVHDYNCKDTMFNFSLIAIENKKKIYRLERSNSNNIHILIAGIYGDLVYHHGAGSRKIIKFWGSRNSPLNIIMNKIVKIFSSYFMFLFYNRYISFLR